MLQQIVLVTLAAVLVIAAMGWRASAFADLWLTPDQQGLRAYQNLEFAQAAQLFRDPHWQGLALYESGQYEQSAATFGRINSAVGFYNRGNAFMKSAAYGKAIAAYEQAVGDLPDWLEARENLQLAIHTLAYIERAREHGDTGDDTELGADDYVFDNTQKRGKEMVITRQSTIEAQSAEKWMRTVDTKTRDFLRTRFLLEASQDRDK